MIVYLFFYIKKVWFSALDLNTENKKVQKEDLILTEEFVSRKIDAHVCCGLTVILQLKESYFEEQKQNSKLQFIILTSINLFASLILTYLIVRFLSYHSKGIIRVYNETFKYNNIQYKGACFLITLALS